MAHQQAADAKEERIAARQHADRLAAPRQNCGQRALDRRRPSQGLRRDGRRQRQMPRAADDKRGLRDQPPCGRRKPVEAVLADADDGEPARRRVTGSDLAERAFAPSHSRRHDGSERARRRDRRARRISKRSCRWPDARSIRRARRSRRASAASAASRVCAPISTPNDIDAVVDATHPFAAQMSRHAARGLRGARSCRCWSSRAPNGARVSGDRWIEVATMEEAAQALGRRAAQCVSDAGAPAARRLRQRAAASLSRARDRAARRRSTLCPRIA